MWLLDTMVLSELRKRNPDQNVVNWLSSTPEKSLFLQCWLVDLMRNYGDRVLPVTAEVACRWGELTAIAGHDGADVLIAATAIQHGLSVVTRNERHFRQFSAQVFNPYDDK
jgi:predicted nucleic acid-binding protein